MSRHPDSCDLCVVGAGMAGMAAALFAAARGLGTVQVGNAGGLLFSSGPLDLLAVHPPRERRTWLDPWAALETMEREMPRHPYGKVSTAHKRAAMVEFVEALGEAGLAYTEPGDDNHRFVTSLGTVKTTYCLPRSMEAGAAALAKKSPGLLVDFRGLREFSARQVAATIAPRWPGLRAVRIPFPGCERAAETHAAVLARALELQEQREALVQRVRPHLQGAEVVGFPAVLGVRRTSEIQQHLQRRLGLPVFEIPMMPTSVPGLRLKEALAQVLSARPVHRMVQANVRAVEPRDGGGFELDVRGSALEHTLQCRAVILATGRFMGQGLTADRGRVRETILDLPVYQPESRAGWHDRDFLAPGGHPVNMAGLEVDETFSALGESGAVAHKGLYAVGSVLAHQDWMRQKCGAGLAITTAWAAVNAACEALGGEA